MKVFLHVCLELIKTQMGGKLCSADPKSVKLNEHTLPDKLFTHIKLTEIRNWLQSFSPARKATRRPSLFTSTATNFCLVLGNHLLDIFLHLAVMSCFDSAQISAVKPTVASASQTW